MKRFGIIRKFKNLLKSLVGNKSNLLLEKSEIDRITKIPRFKTGDTILFDKKIVFTDSVSFLSSYEEIFKNEIYRFPVDDNSKKIIIDCGANIGLATLFFKFNYPGSILLSYEPDPNIFHALEYNVKAFSLKDVSLFNEAIGEKRESLYFNMEGGHSGMLVPEPNERTISVPVTPLKEVLATYDRIDFLKIDIEGHEINVMPSLEDELKKVQNLFLEYHTFLNEPQQLSKIMDILEKAGFRYYIKEAAYKKNPFLQRELFYKMDTLINIFCYRE